MKSSSKKGFALIALVIAMTLIAIIGASFVSIAGSKQEGFTYLLRGQRANMIAKAGVEWAIRYISDGLSNTSSAYYLNLPAQLATNKSFNDGNFSVVWTYNQYDIANDYITVTGTYQGVTETVTLSNFRRYLSPMTLIPNTSQRPRYRTDRRYLDVYVAGNNVTTISRIDFTTNMTNMILQYIILRDIQTGVETTIFDYNNVTYPNCGSPAVAPCVRTVFWGFIDVGLLLRLTETLSSTNDAKLITSTINHNKSYIFIFRFYNNAPFYSPMPLHSVTFNTAPISSQVVFRP